MARPRAAGRPALRFGPIANFVIFGDCPPILVTRDCPGRCLRGGGKGFVIRRGTKVGSFAAVAVFALALGGISAALLVPSGGQVPGNIITAGHLQVEINHGGGSDLSFDNLLPGATQVAYQLISGDMAGVDAADLSMTLSGATDSPFTRSASVSIAASEPAPDGSPNGASCSANVTFAHDVLPAVTLSSLSQESTLPLGTLTNTDNAVCVRFTIGLDKAAGDPVQGASGSLSMLYSLTQNAAVAP